MPSDKALLAILLRIEFALQARAMMRGMAEAR
jgi:hypothetical protein